MRRRGVFVKLGVAAKHADQVLFEPHHQGMDPGVEQHIGALETHLRAVAGGEILHVHGRRNDGTGQAQALGDVPLHLGAQHQFGLQVADALLDLEVVVGDERLAAVLLGCIAHLASEFAAVGAQPHDLKPHLLRSHPGRGHHVRGVSEDEHALARQIGRVNRAGVPASTGLFAQIGHLRQTGQSCHLGHEVLRGMHADWHHPGKRLLELALQPQRGAHAGFGVEHDVEIGLVQAGQIGRAGTHRSHHFDLDAQVSEQPFDFAHIIAMAKTQRRGPEDVAARPLALGSDGAACTRRGAAQVAHHLVEGLGRTPVFLALVRRQLQRHHRHRQIERTRQAAGVVLNQLGRAGRTHHHGPWREALVGLARSGLEQLGRVTAEVARLKSGVGHRRPARQPLDHGKQQVGVGVALGSVQHVMHIRQGGGHPHRAHMGGALVSPQRQLHGCDS